MRLKIYRKIPQLLLLLLFSSLTKSEPQSSSKSYGILNAATPLSENIINSGTMPYLLVQSESDLIHIDTLIINLNQSLDASLANLARLAYLKGKIIVFDNSNAEDLDLSANTISSIIGVGLVESVLIAKRDSQGSLELKAISTASEVNINDKNSLLSNESIKIISSWKEKPSIKDHYIERNVSNSNNNSYKPQVSIPIEFRKLSFPCKVGYDYQGNGYTGNTDWNGTKEDACNGKASASFFYILDLIRSVEATDQSGSADNGKYLRITYDPSSSSGGGWHLTDKPRHEHTWFQSWANRITWFGPLAMNYGVEIRTNDSDVRLFNTIPNNTGLEQEIKEVSGITVGVDAGLKGEIGGEGPTAGGNVGVNFSYNSQRWVTYKTHEYEVKNLSNLNTARWLWDRDFTKNSAHWKTHDTCWLWCTDWFFKDSSFSSAAYANFKPGFSATYRVPADKMGSSKFAIKNSVNIVALGGRVQYDVVQQSYAPWSASGSTYSFIQGFIVNWDAPVFEPEINVSIEAYAKQSNAGLCLSVTEPIINGSAVQVTDCNYDNNQLWGLDSDQRYKSRTGKNLCLQLEASGSLSARTCNSSAQQKWSWDNDRLTNVSGSELALINGVLSTQSANEANYNKWKSYIRKIPAYRALGSYRSASDGNSDSSNNVHIEPTQQDIKSGGIISVFLLIIYSLIAFDLKRIRH